ncbi:MAG: NADH-quinone oxidoreductase subunit C [Candidatus Eiseniibacteriota bacterium]
MGLSPNPEDLDALNADQSRVVERFRSKLGDAVVRERSFRGQLSIWVRRERLLDVLRFVKSDPELDCELLSDVTSVDLSGHQDPGEPRFEVIYNLYSITHRRRILVKTGVDDGQTVPSATAVYPGANFPEREVYDMMGINFEGHPGLERILTPDGWLGHPLRKDFPTRSDQFPNVEN